MKAVTVYHFELYDIQSDSMKRSRRAATLEAIARCKGVVLEVTAQETDTSCLDGEGLLLAKVREESK